jgi:predicted kinase
MRKWMQDKLKRRKKTPQETAAQPAPLQPAYFVPEGETPAPEPQREEPIVEAAATDESEPAAVSDSGASVEPAPPGTTVQPGAGAGRPRRRRGRGGRGRRRPARPIAAPAGATPAAEAGPASPPIAAPVPVNVASIPQRASKGIVVLAIGLPGSGKSSWFKRNNISPLSSDLVRSLLFDDPDEQRFQDLVFSNLRSMLRARLIARRPMNYVDATNLTPHDRHSWIKLAKDSGYEVQALYFDVPLDVCLERNQRRQRVVQEDVMRKMAGKLKPPTFEEGFSKITVVRVKQKE